jgi:small subunit ribosomal protein S13
MAYLFESKVPEEKSVLFALTYIYGINKSTSFLICKKLGFSKNFKISNLSNEQLDLIVKTAELLNLTLSNNLKKIKQLNQKKFISIKSYKGFRKNQGLPIRGQRTHTNAKTARKRLL